MQSLLVDYFGCPERFDHIVWSDEHSDAAGYFRLGDDATCFGHYDRRRQFPDPAEVLNDALDEVTNRDGKVCLPFNPSEIVENLRGELYVGEWRKGVLSLLSNLYYAIRPLLPVHVRRYLQMLHLRDWETISFPSWPVDFSVDNLIRHLMLLSIRSGREDRVPFIWFWPDGHSGSAIITHDVETQEGFEHCSALMEIDDAFAVKASFQIVPEERYLIRPALMEEMRKRGFEICVHDLNHDGHLYRNREQFLRRAAKINAYGREFGAIGFRAAVLYRKQIWYDALQFSYDMSVPNVAHLDPQRGGCCTVMPYFLNGILEIPVTTIQDYSLYHILKDFSLSLWKKQTQLILEKHGCMSFIIHPDYIRQPRELDVYKKLLAYLNELRSEQNVWIATPGEVNHWWRQRAAMRLVETSQGWRIEGEGCERARIGYAREENGLLVLSCDDRSHTGQVVANEAAGDSAGDRSLLPMLFESKIEFNRATQKSNRVSV